MNIKIVNYKTLPKRYVGSLNFIRLLRVVITPSGGENDSKQSDEFQASM